MMATLLAAASLGPWKDASLAGTPVDIAPWCYEYRSDLSVQKQPEAYFIPHRLDRLDKVYRWDSQNVPKDQLKSVAYDLPDLLKPFPPAPRWKLRTGLLWIGPLSDYQVELHWPGKPPSPAEVEVRTYPSAFGWFGWTVDKILTDPEITPDGRTWIYSSGPAEQMDTFYNNRIPAATQMVAVFGDDIPIPRLGITGKSVGEWKRMDIRIEAAHPLGRCRFETHVATLGPVSQSSSPQSSILIQALYAPDAPGGLDSRITIWRKGGGFTFRIKDLDRGRIVIPREGVTISKVDRAGGAQLAGTAKPPLTLRQFTDRHPEASSFEQLMKEVRLWTCPDGTKLKPFPAVPDPPMDVELADPGWTDAWRCAANQLRGHSMWGGLAFEVGRVAHEMDMIGLHDAADNVYNHFLPAPGAKSDGDFTDGAGALEWAKDIRNGMGYMHDGTHPSTGRLLFAMAERYFLTG
ncbi:MAG TPA: hypothetical protein VMI31_03380, partial [Fimbriimonadaceae bacterium]|nr:hypothetical protein [Fimbriimonadaceae bacterium]